MFKIAIVEDNPMFSLFLDHKIKARHNYRISVYQTAEQFLKEANRGYDAIVLDFDLPGMNGLELIKKLKELGIKTPVIIVSGEQDRKNISGMMKEGVYAYFAKERESIPELLATFEKLEEEKARAAGGGLLGAIRRLFSSNKK